MVRMNSAASLCLEHISFSFAERASSECMFTRTRIPNYVQISGRLGVGSDISKMIIISSGGEPERACIADKCFVMAHKSRITAAG